MHFMMASDLSTRDGFRALTPGRACKIELINILSMEYLIAVQKYKTSACIIQRVFEREVHIQVQLETKTVLFEDLKKRFGASKILFDCRNEHFKYFIGDKYFTEVGNYCVIRG